MEYEWYNVSAGEVVSTEQAAYDLEEGDTYRVTVWEKNKCKGNATETFVLSAPTTIASVIVTDNSNCGATATAAPALSGDEKYTFYWYRIFEVTESKNIRNDDGTWELVTSTFDRKELVYTEESSEQSIYNNYNPGRHEVVVENSNGCSLTSDEENLTPSLTNTFELCLKWLPPNCIKPDEIEEDQNLEEVGPEEVADHIEEQINDQLEACIDLQTVGAKVLGEYACNNLDNFEDEVGVQYKLRQGHYTLYYYDRVGNLVRTVPPEGLDIDLENITRTPKNHRMVTNYEYNSLGQLVKQSMPDHNGKSNFKYNNFGELRYSQNPKQANVSDGGETFSYTIYDELGRITETGEMTGSYAAQNVDADPVGTKKWYTETKYSELATDIAYLGQGQRYVRNRVSYISTNDATDPNLSNTSVYFSYDPHGNVEWLIRQLPNGGEFTTEYEYDLISGNVTEVVINKTRKDQFALRYSYDEDNRITAVETSGDLENLGSRMLLMLISIMVL